MKLLFICFLALVTTKTCSQEGVSKIEYQATSRGFYYKVVVNANNVTVTPKRESNSITKKCKAKSWKKLETIVNEIKLKEIKNLKAPSEKSHYDGAASAHITIVKNGNTYISNNFDHGNPPEVLQPLVNQILSLAESIDNQ